MNAAINLNSKLNSFDEYYAPRTVATFNDMDIMVVKACGELNWHVHEDTDDFFLVLRGHLRLETEHGNVELGPGDMYVVPKGVRHRPVAEQECHILLIEPTGTPNTGDASTAASRKVI
ncbi:mannose-6-phosphate isomerase [Lysobacter helvus]|uniref:Mannose-6-phosphate isomerase n=2 Tax=Lysobacteraceae TaxID=32033 RepID=A0ABN6G003_9GAMM|nr:MULTISPECIES: cupin domain-containing protein [Lysobacter]BCT93148.1 mannose-6-phosphate isomerase [Lysobacter caseinilyticus]BCT96300.1 mannose-6-phosphate isomerase [Lysobacter helvus]